jgi:hypothetical protein
MLVVGGGHERAVGDGFCLVVRRPSLEIFSESVQIRYVTSTPCQGDMLRLGDRQRQRRASRRILVAKARQDETRLAEARPRVVAGVSGPEREASEESSGHADRASGTLQAVPESLSTTFHLREAIWPGRSHLRRRTYSSHGLASEWIDPQHTVQAERGV